ncbi:RNA-guided endonuclease TnpB family protein [Streptomyces sioyaensis]|uniref:RNA-guided endonuclease InsQ/TnpB family protein n=1 Tax=Streptomyces sioyaensis TaxID=67364 RepID=UPI0036E6E40A
MAALSQPLASDNPASQFVSNPRHVRRAEKRLTKAQRALSRTEKGSARRAKARRRVGRLHHEVAARRDSALHTLTKQLTTQFATVAIEDLNVAGMTRSARGTVTAPGSRVRQKAGLNRAILDAAPGELRRQLDYKTSWYGSQLAVLGRWWPSSKTCSTCTVGGSDPYPLCGVVSFPLVPLGRVTAALTWANMLRAAPEGSRPQFLRPNYPGRCPSLRIFDVQASLSERFFCALWMDFIKGLVRCVFTEGEAPTITDTTGSTVSELVTAVVLSTYAAFLAAAVFT